MLNIPGGNWNIEFYFAASSGGGTPSFYNELYKVSSANVFTLIASGSTNPEGITQGTVVDQYFTSIPVPQTALLATDRIAIRIFVTPSGRTITLHTEDNNLCEVLTTFSTGLNALNGLTAQVQYFATGTSGTDFAISSATDTHTFNLPIASGTNTGKLSNTDWTTFNNKVGGTGATGQVAYWNGTTSQTGSNNLFWDAANSRLGIGTNAPARTLSVNGSIGIGLNSLIQETGALNLVISQTAFYNLELRTNNATRATIFAGGNFQIGSPTADGGQRLQVYGDAFVKGSGATSATNALLVQNSAGTQLLKIQNDGTGNIPYIFYVGHNSTNPFLFSFDGNSSSSPNASSRNLAYYNTNTTQTGDQTHFALVGNALTPTSGDTRLLLIERSFAPTSGTASYSSLSIASSINQTGGANGITRGLHVNPTLTAAVNWRSVEWSNNTGWGLYGEGSANNYLGGNLSIATTLTPRRLNINQVLGGNAALIGLYSSGSLMGAIGAQATTDNLQFAATAGIVFYSGSTIGNAATEPTNERMRLFTSGNLAIGSTTDNGSRLQISGNASITKTGTIRFDYSSGTSAMYIGDGSADMFLSTQVAGAGNNPIGAYIYLKHSSANVGIGTTSPVYKMHVFNSGSVTSAIEASGAGADSILRFISPSQYWTITNDGTSANLTFNRGGTDLIRFSNVGNLLVGTTVDAGYKFDVVSASTPIARFTGATNAYIDITDGIVNSRIQNSGGLLIGTTTSHDLILRTNSVSRLTITAAGATTISNLAGTGTRLVVADTNGLLSTQSIGSGVVTGTGTTNYIPKWTSASALGNSIVQDNGSAVGIGVSSFIGGYKLEVSGLQRNFGANNELRFGEFDANYNYFQGINLAGTVSRGFIFFGTGEYMRITPSSNLLVGTTTDSGYKLDVNGSGRFNGGASGVGLSVKNATNARVLEMGYSTGTGAHFLQVYDGSSFQSLIINNALTLASTGAATFSSSVTAGGDVVVNSGTVSINSSSYPKIRLNDTNVGGGIYYWQSIVGVLRLVDEVAGTERARFTAGGNLLVNSTTDNGNRLQVTGNGYFSANVGIGTAGPYFAKLQVNASGAGFQDALILENTNSASANLGTALTFAGAGSAAQTVIRSAWDGAATTDAYMSFLTKGSGSVTERMRLTSSGNLGLGVTPSAWAINPALQIKDGGSFWALNNQNLFLSQNVYFDGSFRYIASVSASKYQQSSGTHLWLTAPSGTAGNAITFTQAMTLTSGGNLLVGTTADQGYRVQITGSGDNMLNVWGATAPSIRLDNAASGATQRFVIGLATATNNFIQGASAGDVCITTATASPMVFGMWQTSTASEVMRITTSNNLLINKTADGGQKLQVSGKVNFASLPTSATGLSAGDIWNNGGVLNIV